MVRGIQVHEQRELYGAFEEEGPGRQLGAVIGSSGFGTDFLGLNLSRDPL